MPDRNDRDPRISHRRRVLTPQHLTLPGPGRVVPRDGDHRLTARAAVTTTATMEGNERGRPGQVPGALGELTAVTATAAGNGWHQ